MTTAINVPENSCQDSRLTSFDLSPLPDIETINIAASSYSHVSTVIIDGLQKLKSISINNYCFQDLITKDVKTNSVTPLSGSSFSLRNCPEITYLTIGLSSFSVYTSCKIENNPKMTSLTIAGGKNEHSYSFDYADLEIRSNLWVRGLGVDMSSLQTATFGTYTFYYCKHVTFESTGKNCHFP